MKHIRVMYEVNLHVTPLSVRNVTTDLLVRKVRGCNSVGMLILEKKASVTHRLVCFKQLWTDEISLLKGDPNSFSLLQYIN